VKTPRKRRHIPLFFGANHPVHGRITITGRGRAWAAAVLYRALEDERFGAAPTKPITVQDMNA
jgi:hypothetical protein